MVAEYFSFLTGMISGRWRNPIRSCLGHKQPDQPIHLLPLFLCLLAAVALHRGRREAGKDNEGKRPQEATGGSYAEKNCTPGEVTRVTLRSTVLVTSISLICNTPTLSRGSAFLFTQELIPQTLCLTAVYRVSRSKRKVNLENPRHFEMSVLVSSLNRVTYENAISKSGSPTCARAH